MRKLVAIIIELSIYVIMLSSDYVFKTPNYLFIFCPHGTP